MKATLKKYVLFLFAVALLFGCKPEENFITPSINPNITKKFSVIRPPFPDHVNQYNKNLDVVWETSYFHVVDKELTIETPVPNTLFEVKNIYFYEQGLYTVLFVHVSDGDVIPARSQTKDFLLKGTVAFKEIEHRSGSGVKFNPNRDDLVLVVIYNNSSFESFIEFVKPEEAGCGVIVGRP